MTLNKNNTIYAPLTPLGRSAISVIRISGPETKSIISFFSKKIDKFPRTAQLVTMKDKDGNIIDEPMVIWFKEPNSFTGEDVVEIYAHGGIAITKNIFKLLEYIGFTYAKPGEFTSRAIYNKKMTLDKAEAIFDMINSNTTNQMRNAIKSIQTIKHIEEWHKSITEIISSTEALIDFSDDIESEQDIKQKINIQIQELKDQMKKISKHTAEEIIKSGISIVIFGPPNTGKSTLINCLLKSDTSIVSSIPGTTRDLIESNIEINGEVALIIDTAGIRNETQDPIEIEGIKRAVNKIKTAQIKIAVIDFNNIKNDLKEISCLIDNTTLIIANKADNAKTSQTILYYNNNIITASIHNNVGIIEIINKISDKIKQNNSYENDCILIRERYKNEITNVIKQINSINQNTPIEILAHSMKLALQSIGNIIDQKFDSEKLLDNIFSNFCIGK